MGTSVWRKTENFVMSLSAEFSYTYNATEEVEKPVEALCELCLPGASRFGNIQIPGPSIADAIGGEFPNTVPSSYYGKPINVEDKEDAGTEENAVDKYVNIVIGHKTFLGWLITRAEPTYSKFHDETGGSIYCRVAIEARSMFTATKNDMRAWKR